jgi:predicted metalloprotease
MQQRDAGAANQLSVRLELQADCFAGIWAHRANREGNFLEPGDIEEGLRAASAVGDDTLQRSAGRAVVPDAFTHGSSEQRVRWFNTGYERGSFEACDTFGSGDV